MIRKSGHRFSLATNAKRLRRDHAQTKSRFENRQNNGSGTMRLSRHALTIAFLLGGIATAVAAEEIRIGQTLPYSGPVSGFGIIGKAEEAYFEKVNAEGGINGRKIKLISLDDAYSPPKTVEQTRKLVEQ